MIEQRVMMRLLAACLATACSSESELADGPGSVQVNGAEVVYEAYGAGEPAMVFVHGGLNNRSVWADGMEAFAGERRVVSLDLPGHGESEPPDAISAAVFADAVTGVMDAAAVEDAVIVGHSFGVSVARDVAVAHPERVAGLAMLDGFLVPLGTDPIMREAVLAQFQSDAWAQAAAVFVESYMFGASTSDAVKEIVRGMMLSAPQDLWIAVLTIAFSEAIARDDVVDVPTYATFLGGPTLPPDYQGYLVERFPDLAFEVQPAGTGHFIMLERPDAFEQALRELVGRSE